jgi:hypothetical protein
MGWNLSPEPRYHHREALVSYICNKLYDNISELQSMEIILTKINEVNDEIIQFSKR